MIPAKSRRLKNRLVSMDWPHNFLENILNSSPQNPIFIVELACLEQELLQANPKQMRRQHTN
jgi:hypothetical protein